MYLIIYVNRAQTSEVSKTNHTLFFLFRKLKPSLYTVHGKNRRSVDRSLVKEPTNSPLLFICHHIQIQSPNHLDWPAWSPFFSAGICSPAAAASEFLSVSYLDLDSSPPYRYYSPPHLDYFSFPDKWSYSLYFDFDFSCSVSPRIAHK